MAKKTKNEIIAEQVADAVGAGRKHYAETVNYNDPNRPKTCLEVDFPILPINQIAQIEGNAGKPIYQMSKWWARRRSSVFRAILIAAATKSPEDSLETAKTVWGSYYANHQDNDAFRNIKVADIFMGGGTTLVEGSRLGMQMYGNDLNPVAWLVAKNELANVDINEVNKLFDHIEREVKPQIMPFYACNGPGGEKGEWTHIPSGKKVGEDFDPLSLLPEERKDYSYFGPEIIYTFWAKHGPCAAPNCGHRTPLMTTPVVAVKTLSVKAWLNYKCSQCGHIFDLEKDEARMAPDETLIVAETEKAFAIMDAKGNYTCPGCGYQTEDYAAAVKGHSNNLGKPKSKKVEMSLLLHPSWLKGSPSIDESKLPLGGSATDSAESTIKWNNFRTSQLKLLEIRGKLPQEITCPETGQRIHTNKNGGTIPKKSTFTCQEQTCGRQHDVLKAIKLTGKNGPMAAFVLQGYSPQRKENKKTYNGRFFRALSVDDTKKINASIREWEIRKDGDLKKYWPKSELPFGFMTHQNNGGIPNHGFTHWYKMFNARQLLVHALILEAIDNAYGFSDDVKDFVLGAFQQFLAYENMFCFWHRSHDHFAPSLSNNNYHPKNTSIEVGVFSPVGYGPWRSAALPLNAALQWKKDPWELVPTKLLLDNNHFDYPLTGKSQKVYPKDFVHSANEIICCSSTELNNWESNYFDLIITDPPFGGLLHYSELADFFHVWLRLHLKDKYHDIFQAEYTPKTLEAVANRARHPDDPEAFYKRLLTECWKEANRILKPGGLLVFTFHHSEDDPWLDVLESLFDAGFYLEATYPIRSDETKGEGAKPGTFGSQTIEYDIIHVCRKKVEEPQKVSWARLRKKILQDVRQLQEIIELHQNQGLPDADIQVIKRGKALEYYSRHYNRVYIEEGRTFTVKDALVGINQLLDDQTESEAGTTPVIAEPTTRQFLRIFRKTNEVPRDQMQKYLRGTGMGPSDFLNRGWCMEKKKIFYWISPLEIAQKLNKKPIQVVRDFDQAMWIVGACYPESGINVKKILTDDFKPHPALGDLITWIGHNGGDPTMKNAAMVAKPLFNKWKTEHTETVAKQLSLFDLIDEV